MNVLFFSYNVTQKRVVTQASMTAKKFYTMFDICHFVSVLDNLTRPVVTYKYYISQKWP